MTHIEDEAQEAQNFSAILKPHRSLSPTGFLILMLAIGSVSFAAGIVFALQGAWPVFGYFGLDVALIYLAFRLNYRSGRLYETIDLTDDALTVTRVRPSGEQQSWTFHPYWVRLDLRDRPGRASELSLSLHGRRLVFASFLTDAERHELATALNEALLAQRGGVRI